MGMPCSAMGKKKKKRKSILFIICDGQKNNRALSSFFVDGNLLDTSGFG